MGGWADSNSIETARDLPKPVSFDSPPQPLDLPPPYYVAAPDQPSQPAPTQVVDRQAYWLQQQQQADEARQASLEAQQRFAAGLVNSGLPSIQPLVEQDPRLQDLYGAAGARMPGNYDPNDVGSQLQQAGPLGYVNRTLNLPFEGQSALIDKIPTGGGTNLGERVENIPNPIARGAAQFGISAIPYAETAGLGGGAGLGLAGLQAGQVGEQYASGDLTGKEALAQLAVAVGPILAPELIKVGIDTVPKAQAFLASPEGKAYLASKNLAGERGEMQLPRGKEPNALTQRMDQPPDPLAPVTDWLRSANVLRQKQDINVADFRKRQAGAIGSVDKNLPPEERLNAKLAAARGRSAQETIWIPSEQAIPAVQHGINLIEDSTIPELGAPQARMNLQNAWRNFLLTGELPQPNQLDKMEQVFGPTIVKEIRQFNPPKGGFSPTDLYINASNFVRTMKTIIPLHGMLRNGVFEAPGNPRIWLNQFLPQLKGLKDPSFQRALNEDIHSDPGMHRADGTGGLDFRADGRGPRLKIFDMKELNPNERAEDVMSQWADSIPGVSHLKNNYLTFRNDYSRQLYNAQAEALRNPSALARLLGAKPETDPAAFDLLGDHINHGTGWSRFQVGDLSPKINPFFAPKRFAAMLQWPADLVSALRGGQYNVARLIAKDLAAFTGTAVVGLGLAKLAGPRVGVDAGVDPFQPSDFGKIRIGSQTIDTLGGSAQIVGSMAQLMSGRRDAAGVNYETSRKRVVEDFIRGKLEPLASAGVDLYTGKNVVGQKVSITDRKAMVDEAVNAFTPIVIEEMIKAAEEEQWKGVAVGIVPAILGAGVQEHVPTPGSKAGLLEALNLPKDASPEDIYKASQANPEAVKTYHDAQAERDTPTGHYQDFVNTALGVQSQRDQWLKDGKDSTGKPYTGQNWKDGFHQMESDLQAARNALGLKPLTSDDPALKGYDDIWSKYTAADGTIADTNGLYDALDKYRAELSPEGLKRLDSTLGWSLNQTPVMKEYRDTTKALDAHKFFDAGKTILKQMGVPDQFHSVGDLINYSVDQVMQSLPENQRDPSLRQLIVNKVSPRFVKLEQAINIYKLSLIGNDAELESEAVKFGLIQTKAALVLDLANNQ